MRPVHSLLSIVTGAMIGAGAFLGCANACAPRPGGAGLSIMAYNVHNLFDAADAGTEYPEYSVESGSWDDARYRSRLGDLARVIVAAEPSRRGPDLVCLEEVEGLAVLEDLRSGPLRASGYSAAALVAAPGQAVNCGLLSRLPLTRVMAHALVAGKVPALVGGMEAATADVEDGPRAARPSGRYLLEAGVEVEGHDLTVLVCHWKSKLGGAEATEGERREDAALLASRVAALLARDPEAAVLACGDFNESPDEFERVGRAYETALMPVTSRGARGPCLLVAADPSAAGLGAGDSLALYSPWSGAEGWSYLNKGRGERIDGFLLAPGLLSAWRVLSFEALAPAFLLDSKGAPVAYDPAKGRGFSDHLPILLRLALPGS